MGVSIIMVRPPYRRGGLSGADCLVRACRPGDWTVTVQSLRHPPEAGAGEQGLTIG